MYKYHNKQAGFVKFIIIIVIAIGLLAYFKVDIRDLINDYVDKDGLIDILISIKEFFLKIWTFIVDFWQEHIKPWVESQRNG